MKIFFYDEGVHEPPIENFMARYRMERNRKYYTQISETLKEFRTASIEEADFAFAPINLIEWQFTNLNSKIKQIVSEKLFYLNKKPHIMCAFGDFGQRKRSIYESNSPDRAYNELYEWLDNRFILLAFESTQDLLHQDVAVFPWTESVQQKKKSWIFSFQKKERRDLLFSFVGQTSYYPRLPSNHIRGGRLLHIAYNNRIGFIGTPNEARARWGRRGEYFRMLRRSVFTLCPAGYGRYSYRVGEALEYGSIPVILSDGYILPLSAHLPWEKVCLHIQESEYSDLSKVLESTGTNQISNYQKNINQLKNLFAGKSIASLVANELHKKTSFIIN